MPVNYENYNPDYGRTKVPDSLVIKHWARQIWKSGIDESFFKKFMGHSSKSIIHIKEELAKGPGDSINIPLRMPLFGAGVIGDAWLERKEEKMTFRDFYVPLNYLRHGVILNGKFEEQRTQINLRSEMREALTDWLARYFDCAFFAMGTGTKFPLIKNPGDVFPFDVEPPSADRILFAGSATTEQTITAADTFDAALISRAKRAAIKDEITAIRPVMVDGRETYVLVIDHWQARDLRRDPVWLEAQEHANVRGEKNPIFSGAMGIYDGVVIHECGRVPRTTSGQGSTLDTDGYYTGGVTVGHAMLLGAQAFVLAEGKEPKLIPKDFDYEDKHGLSIARMFGIKRSAFKYDGTNWTDYGVLNIMTASVED